VVSVKTMQLSETFVLSLSQKQRQTTQLYYSDLVFLNPDSPMDTQSNSHILIELLFPESNSTFISGSARNPIRIPGYQLKAFGIAPFFESMTGKEFLTP
jgi:hypothetical protein